MSILTDCFAFPVSLRYHEYLILSFHKEEKRSANGITGGRRGHRSIYHVLPPTPNAVHNRHFLNDDGAFYV